MIEQTNTQRPSWSRRLGVGGIVPGATVLVAAGLGSIGLLEALSANPDEWFPGMGWIVAGMMVGTIGFAFALITLVGSLAMLAAQRFTGRYRSTSDLRAVAAANACVIAVGGSALAILAR